MDFYNVLFAQKFGHCEDFYSGLLAKQTGGKWLTASGSVASFNALKGKLKSLIVDIDPVQEGSGDPSPSNVRPISGRDEVNITNDPIYGGTIAWNQLWSTDASAYTTRFSSLTYSDGVFTHTITATNLARKHAYISTLTVGHKYVLIAEAQNHTTSYAYIWQGTPAGTDINPRTNIIKWATTENEWTLKSSIFNAEYESIAFGTTSDDRTVGDYVLYRNVQLIDLTQMFDSTIADYIYSLEQNTAGAGVAWFRNLFPDDFYEFNAGEETCVSAVNGDPYDTYEIELTDGENPLTVYGGTLNVVSGELNVTHGEIASYDGETLPSTWISDRDVYASGTTPTTGAQVVYELSEPITYQLTPIQIQSLKGSNNIWVDSGDVEVIYKGK